MNYPRGLLLYQDNASSGWILRLILLIIPAVLFIIGLYLWYAGEGGASAIFVIEGVVIGLILWFMLPRMYQVYEDRLRIVFGGNLGLNIGFSQLKKVEVATRTSLTLNLVTRIARTYVVIVKKRDLSIAITPGNNELFVENATRALDQWKKNNQN